jgi:hypothetical protein
MGVCRMGMAPVGRREFKRLLDQGTTCVLVPGGVSECLYMERDKEVRPACAAVPRRPAPMIAEWPHREDGSLASAPHSACLADCG